MTPTKPIKLLELNGCPIKNVLTVEDINIDIAQGRGIFL